MFIGSSPHSQLGLLQDGQVSSRLFTYSGKMKPVYSLPGRHLILEGIYRLRGNKLNMCMLFKNVFSQCTYLTIEQEAQDDPHTHI